MTKREAIEKMVGEFSNISQDQFRTLAEKAGEYFNLPMWGTMWRIDYGGEDLYDNSRIMHETLQDALDEYPSDQAEKIKANEEEYIDEEMAGSHCVLDKDGNTTAMFIYELDGEYWLGVNGAGWDFYSGVWAKLYDVMGLQWHDACELVVDALHDAQAHCKGCGWHYAATGERTRAEIEEEFNKSHN